MTELANPSDLPPEVIEAFGLAATTTLRELTQLEAVPVVGPRGFTKQSTETFVLATMRLIRTFPGTMTLVMSAQTAERLAERYLPAGTELTEDIVDDVAGEFANVIAGQAKTILKGTPYHFLLSHPVVSRSATGAKLDVAATFTIDSGQVELHVNLLPAE
jgi:chemotaxis protein CheX